MYFFPLAKSIGQETHKTVIYLIIFSQRMKLKNEFTIFNLLFYPILKLYLSFLLPVYLNDVFQTF